MNVTPPPFHDKAPEDHSDIHCGGGQPILPPVWNSEGVGGVDPDLYQAHPPHVPPRPPYMTDPSVSQTLKGSYMAFYTKYTGASEKN